MPAHAGIAVRPQAIPPAQRDEQVARPWIGQAEADLDRLLALLLLPQPGADAVRRGAGGGFLPGRGGPGEQRLDLAKLVPERGFVVHPRPRWRIGSQACYGWRREESPWRMQSSAERTAGGMRSISKAMEITVEVFFGNETVEIAIEAPEDPAPSDKRRFALLNVPRELFNKALGEAARRSKSQRPAILAEGR